jgi:hypothetical protein
MLSCDLLYVTSSVKGNPSYGYFSNTYNFFVKFAMFSKRAFNTEILFYKGLPGFPFLVFCKIKLAIIVILIQNMSLMLTL